MSSTRPGKLPHLASDDLAVGIAAAAAATATATSSAALDSQALIIIPLAVLLLVRILKKRYLRAKVKLNEGLTLKPTSKPLDQVYVNLLLLPSNELTESVHDKDFLLGSHNDLERFMHVFMQRPGHELQKISLAEIFAEATEVMQSEDREGESYRVLVTASAGTGKSLTFLHKAALDWANGDIWQESSIFVAAPLRLPSVRHAQDIIELLQLRQNGITGEQNQETIVLFLLEYPEKLCLVLDGLDEVEWDDCSGFVRSVITGDILKGIRFILTSRHSNQIHRLASSHPFDKHIELVGFTRENVLKYIGKVLPEQKAEDLVKVHIQKHPKIAALMRTPFFTAAICDVYRCHSKLPETLTEVFEMLLLLVVRQNTGDLYTSWKLLPRQLQEQILELSHFLFKMLAVKKVVFRSSVRPTFKITVCPEKLVPQVS